MDDYYRYDIEPNADSYSFLLQAIAVDAMTLFPVNISSNHHDDAEMNKNIVGFKMSPNLDHLEAAEAVLLEMEDRGISTNQYVLHEYIRILVYTNELKRAKEVIQQALQDQKAVSLDTLMLLGMNFIDTRHKEEGLEDAKEIADWIKNKAGYCDVPCTLMNRIQVLEKSLKKDQEVM